jgi:hypothetical protein
LKQLLLGCRVLISLSQEVDRLLLDDLDGALLLTGDSSRLLFLSIDSIIRAKTPFEFQSLSIFPLEPLFRNLLDNLALLSYGKCSFLPTSLEHPSGTLRDITFVPALGWWWLMVTVIVLRTKRLIFRLKRLVERALASLTREWLVKLGLLRLDFFHVQSNVVKVSPTSCQF